jgi:hypothetical protein
MRPSWELKREREKALKAADATYKKERRKAISETRKVIKEYKITPHELWDWLHENDRDFLRQKVSEELERQKNTAPHTANE